MTYTLALALGAEQCALAYGERGGQPQALPLPALSAPDGCIPTALYCAADGSVRVGAAASPFRAERRRFFGRIPALVWAQPQPAPRLLDGAAWDAHKVGAAFFAAIFAALPFPLDQVERLILSAPPFENAHSATRYVRWLHETLTALGIPEARLYLMSELDALALSGGVWSAEAPLVCVQAESPDSFVATFGYLSAAKSLSVRLDQALRGGVPFASLLSERFSLQSFEDALADCLAYAAEQALSPSDLIYLLLSDCAAFPAPLAAAERTWAARCALTTGVRALAEGLLQTPARLQNSYGLRYRSADGGYAYIELAPSGTPFPAALRTVRLAAAHDDQPAIEFVIGMFDPEAKGHITLDATSLSYTLEPSELGALALNEFAPPLRVALPPPVRAAEPRLAAAFRLDSERQLRLTATDLRTGALLADDAVITTLY
ncbi:MAG: hypothetical protein ACK4P1_02460 [Aggregatilineales bacterium]